MKIQQRPYCKTCKTVWSKHEINSVKQCSTCHSPVVLTSFYPILKAIGGLGVIILSLFTIVFMQIAFLWIVGCIIGIILFLNGLKENKSLRKLDRKAKSINEKPKLNKNVLVVTCGECNTKINVKKGKGIVKVKCPECLGEYKVRS